MVPEIATLLMVIAAAVPLLKVTDCGDVVDPTVVLAKVRLVGEAVTLPGLDAAPVPDKAI